MKFYSTNHSIPPATFEEAIFQGLPADNGLFMPENIPVLPDTFYKKLPGLALPEVAFEVLSPFVDEEIEPEVLKEIVEDVFNFEIPLVQIKENEYALELFHGPTLAFKDVGARFLARCLSHFSKKRKEKLTVLVATSGDTGSAVAHGFYGVPNIDVIILYPSGKVSAFQEQQMTTLGKNIIALEVDGTFDDCQHLVKQAFLDQDLRQQKNLTSANSINIARLLPQNVYYFHGWGQLPGHEKENAVFSVPSGNYGNLSAGLIAQKMGLPIKHFLACSNANDTVPKYLTTGEYTPKPSVATLSNAMDVGAPSNFVRLLDLFDSGHSEMTQSITGYSFNDEQTKKTIRKTYMETQYVLDPHGSVGYLGMDDYLSNHDFAGVVLETAHPIKFRDTVENEIGKELIMPKHVDVHNKEKESRPMNTDFSSFRAFLLEG